MNRLSAPLALLTLLALAAPARAADGRWQLGLSFGEIPVLAGSFKPGITVGYRLDDTLFLGLELQAADHLQRDGSSFNARNTGLDGLVSSTERTGMRAFLGLRYRPWRDAPHLALGLVMNGEDREVMDFDARPRVIGGAATDGALRIVQTRGRGVGLAVGLGYALSLGGPVSLDTGLAMALLGDVPTPRVQFAGAGAPEGEAADAFRAALERAYAGNIHNRYHLFTLGLSYRLD